MGDSGDLGHSGNWGKSLYVAKIENLMARRRIREIGSLGDSGDWEVPEIGRLEDLEIREIGKNRYMWQKIRTPWDPGGFGSFERLGISGDSGDSGDTGDTGDTGDSGDSGDSGDWGKSLYVAKIENLLEPRRIREIGSLGVWEIREIGRFRKLGDWKI